MERQRERLSREPGDERRGWRAFEDAWRRAADRPPRLAGSAAARRVVARLEPPPRRRAALRWAAAAGLAAVLALAVALGWWDSRRSESLLAPETVAAAEAPLPLDDGVVLLWLDDETPLYLTLTPPRSGAAQTGGTRR